MAPAQENRTFSSPLEPPQRLLLLDSCHEWGFVALWEAGTTLFCKRQPATPTGAQQLPLLLEEALKAHAILLSTVQLIAVTVGPGSYTGLRAALVMAKTMAYAMHKPLIALSSLELLLPPADLLPSRSCFYSLLDARMGGLYHSRAMIDLGKPHFSLARLDSWEQFYNEVEEGALLVTPHLAAIQARLGANEKELLVLEQLPSSDWMGQLALERYAEGSLADPRDVAALYLRKTQAEINLA